jgi:hypothetical protein
MNPTEATARESVPEEAPPRRVFRFSLLSFLWAITIFSVSAGPILHYGGLDALVAAAGILAAIFLLCLTAHLFAEWILMPEQERPALWMMAQFWCVGGCALLFMAAVNAERIIRRPWASWEPDMPGAQSTANFALASVVCFLIALVRHLRPAMPKRTSTPDEP